MLIISLFNKALSPCFGRPEKAMRSTPEFNELIKRVTNPSERQRIMDKLEQVPPGKRDEVIQMVLSGDYERPIIYDLDFQYYALDAVRTGEISATVFGTLMLYVSAMECHGGRDKVQVVPLFRGGVINEDAREAFRCSTVKLDENHPSPFLSEQEIEALFEKMKRRDLSEQNIFIMELDLMASTVSDEIVFSLGLNIFNQISSARQLLPSLGLIEEMLSLKFQENAVKIQPVLGMSPLEEIVDYGTKGIRPIAIPFPGIELSPTADGFAAPYYHFSIHDIYHAIAASCAPAEHRRLFIRIAGIVHEALKTSSSKDRPGLQKWYEILIDFELAGYLEEKPDEMFWKLLIKRYVDLSAQPGLSMNHALAVEIFSQIGQLARGVIEMSPRVALAEERAEIEAVLHFKKSKTTLKNRQATEKASQDIERAQEALQIIAALTIGWSK